MPEGIGMKYFVAAIFINIYIMIGVGFGLEVLTKPNTSDLSDREIRIISTIVWPCAIGVILVKEMRK